MEKLLADINLAPDGGYTGPGPLGTPTNAPVQFENLISTIVGVMTIIGGIWFVFLFLTGAVSIIASGGDKGAYESARKRMTTGVIGIVILVVALFLIDLIGAFLGFPLLDLVGFIKRVTG